MKLLELANELILTNFTDYLQSLSVSLFVILKMMKQIVQINSVVSSVV